MKRTFICVLNEQGKIVHEGSEKTDPHLLADYFSKKDFQEIIVGFESGSLSHYLVTGFRERAIDPICMDARRLSPILALKINKTIKMMHEESQKPFGQICIPECIVSLKNL